MPTPPSESEKYRREVQSRIQNLLSGQRPRHPVLSQYSTRRLIFEGVLEEVRIYRLNKEQKALMAREDAARMNERCGKERINSGGRGSHAEEQGESSRRGRRRDNHDEDEKRLLAGDVAHYDAELHGGDPEFMMSGGALGPPPLEKTAAQSKHSSPGNTKKKHSYSRLRSQSPAEGSSKGKQRFDRNGKALVRGKRGWRDASPGPFPEYKFKMGPMLGVGDHLKERLQWGVDSYYLEQRRKERRERGKLDERRKVRTGKENEKHDNADSKGKTNMSKSEGKKTVKDSHVSHERRGAPLKGTPSPDSSYGNLQHGQDSREKVMRDGGRRTRVSHADQMKKGEQPRGNKHRSRNERKGSHDTEADAAQKAYAEADTRPRAQRHARDEAEASNSSSGNRGMRRLDPHIPVYEQTPHSQRVEAREQAEAEHANINDEGLRETVHLERSANEEPSHRPNDTQDPQYLGTTATLVSQWWSDRSETPSEDGRHDSHDSDDERYFSDHFIEELRSRTSSVASGSTTPRPQGPVHGRNDEDQNEKPSGPSSPSSSPKPPSSSVSTISAPDSPASPSARTPSGSHPLSVHTPSESGRSSLSEKIRTQKLASDPNEPSNDVDEAGRRDYAG
ncbi:hypothetical protein P171DRAFT_442219 [Karstenula rhodostoma CBS 690.94]|uniref:Uncharacterized protein n=1 Tax=Karstenula rhodostoma CBS 690.94 TaxID=1392251 RepID=A0A9P4UF99_9PLEO|nr:hypothetical protein P171DRAFT_442219 [Karstenula rhodostoma CBS 690.94]